MSKTSNDFRDDHGRRVLILDAIGVFQPVDQTVDRSPTGRSTPPHVLPACTGIVPIRRMSWSLSGQCRDPWQQRVSVSRVLLRLWAMHRDDFPEDILTPSKFDAGEGYRQAGLVPIVFTISAGCRKTMSGRAVTSASPRVYPQVTAPKSQDAALAAS
jgi:hypothetical protein